MSVMLISLLIFAVFGPVSAEWGCGCLTLNSDGITCASCCPDWSGDDCSTFTGHCHDLCWSCYGPGLEDCKYCIDHASKNFDTPSVCECDPNWYGQGCKYYQSQTYAPVGDCDPKCFGGCVGPTSLDCVRCIETAHLNQHGACECNQFFGGVACDQPVDQYCDGRCYGGCNGATNYDCNQCVPNAHLVYGACICKDHWTGSDCSQYLQSGECHPICDPDHGCIGSSTNDCVQCVKNAHKNYHGCCECDNFWYGGDCSLWSGSCDHKCAHGCSGPTAADWFTCVDKAEILDNECVCKEGYGGDSCSIYLGPCNDICYGCKGPDATDCDYCVDNATKDEYGQCQCDWQRQGPSCEEYVYQGECDPICNSDAGCKGPTAADCGECNEHAFEDAVGACQCEAYWSSADCGTYVYTGHCHRLCDGECYGPSATDCTQCVPHAHRDSNSTCVCDSAWSGDDCSVRAYVVGCHPVCDQRQGCSGPSADNCFRCNDYSERNFEGYCTCKDGYHGENCVDYSGPCHPMCSPNIDSLTDNECDGPNACDCYSCVSHASQDDVGCCKCDKFWEGNYCERYNAPCHPICQGCYGPSACDCEVCVEHAHKDNDTCVCDRDWEGEDCSLYVGQCHPNCLEGNCHGPEDCDCDYCTDNAQFDERNYCLCIGNWSGIGCSEYSGVCHPICATCSGPNAGDCISCVENAEMNGEKGECSCSQNWDSLDCSEWIGDCDIRCNGCSGPNPCDCKSCNANAHFDHDRLCTCNDLYSGYSCTEYHGYCDSRCIGCFGSSNKDCDGCVRNAHRDELGSCSCDSDWRGEDCSVYAGQCHPKCEDGCFGPSDADCTNCICHSTRNSETHQCVCNEFWAGPDCSYYMGLCDPTCIGCSGPLTNDESPKNIGICEECVAHSHRDSQGRCVCDEHWSSANDCSVYDGPCWKFCAQPRGDSEPRGCYGPTEGNCFECIEHSYRSLDGYCTCSRDWGDPDNGPVCSAYTGQCDHRCSYGCTGPTNAHCLECVEHADGSPCECVHGWYGVACQGFTLACDARCRGCNGPSNNHCDECVENAFREADGACVCKEGWQQWNELDSCNKFVNCDPICAKSDPDEVILGLFSHNYQEERTCTGLGTALCVSCITNSHRNLSGQCECDYGWTGPDCTSWSGECDLKCAYSCHGPTAHHCNKWAENAMRDNDAALTMDQECVCMEWWTGDDCSIYRGVCADTCIGCNGPEAKHCYDCVRNAYYDADGSCVCRDGWVGDDCEEIREGCHATCEICLDSNKNECVTCKAGFLLFNGYCVKPYECCKLWGENLECLACQPGFAFDQETFSCQPCHPACKTCEGDYLSAAACTSCHEDSTLGVSGHCLCDFPKVRLLSSYTCENICPTGTQFNVFDRTCIPDSPFMYDGPSDYLSEQIYFTLEYPTPVFNAIPPTSQYEYINSVYVDSCNPPIALGEHRGSYFNGKDSVLNFHNFQAFDTYAIEMWTKVNIGDATLAVFDAYLSVPWLYYDPPCNCTEYNHEEENVWKGKVDFWISDCFTPVITLHDFSDLEESRMNPVLTNSFFKIDRIWTKLAYSIIVNPSGSGSTIFIYEHGVMMHAEDLPVTIFKAVGDDLQSSLGSFHGAAYFLQGFIFDFKYSQNHILKLSGPDSALFSDDRDLDIDDYSAIGWKQYRDAKGALWDCHPTCARGCTNGDPCYECHPTCRTCMGPSVDDCVDCWCGAEVDSSGCCQCNTAQNFEQDGDKCKQTGCYIEGCNGCLDGICIHCEYGYTLNELMICQRCNTESKENIGSDMRLCAERGVRRDSGWCSCTGFAPDEGACRVCSKGCGVCIVTEEQPRPVCQVCDDGYVIYDDMPHLCAFVPDEDYLPLGYSIRYGELRSTSNFQYLFDFYLSMHLEPYVGSYYTWSTSWVNWTVQLFPLDPSREFVNYPRLDRGLWFDGKNNSLIMDAVLPPRLGMQFLVKPYTDGTLFSVNGIFDQPNQHLISAGIRGRRLESSVEYGDDLYHSDEFNQVIANYTDSGFVPEGSIHSKSPYIPNKRYSRTDKDCVSMQEWQLLGFKFDYSYDDDVYSFQYWVNNMVIDTAHYAVLTNIFWASSIYPTIVLIGAQEVELAQTNMFRGFMYAITGDNGKYDWLPEQPWDNFDWLGMCEWNEFANMRQECERCPYWCEEGCFITGNCLDFDIPEDWLS